MISFDKGTTGRYNGFLYRTEEYLMKLTIFGATGGTGKQLIEQALAAGNEVVAFARTPSKINTSHEHLAIVRGELADPAAIERAIRGADAVISMLSPRPQEDLRRMPLTQGM
jgi:putative NADH-flavin reductase